MTFSGSANVTRLNNGNTYINNTAVNGGVVKLSAAENIPSGVTVPGSTGWLVLDGGITFSAGVLDLNGFNQTANALSGLGNTVNGVITNSGASAATTNMITVLGTAGDVQRRDQRQRLRFQNRLDPLGHQRTALGWQLQL